ncbi:DUF4139 domain-containing protein [Phaeobacter sp. B1627]|uniref:DUF4139 domain-containing protein n=1 Tax=Phaeobacter sp. B1627 TaxID=2583809 RepID=UPI00111A949E|nr:DUF4139 domain-containing protein [Phaeobacter sp. B1627]TNJ41382.1 mucoidy inhibitor MuiA family protein [Phaeobacter sp. B1627]
MRFILSLSATLMASAALADTYSVASRVSAVTVYPSEALITRKAELEVPAGRHRIVVRGLPDVELVSMLQVNHPGLERMGLYLRQDFPVHEDLDTPERDAAEARVNEIEAEIAAVRRAVAEARLAAEGAEAVVGFLGQLGRAQATVLPTAEQLQDLVDTLAEQTAAAHETILRSEAESAEIQRQVEDLEVRRAAAQAELDALSQQNKERMYLALDVVAATDTSVPITISYPAYEVSWSPSYEFDLETGADPVITLRRDIKITQGTGEDWTNVDLRVSTSTPNQRISGTQIYPELRRIEDPDQLQKSTQDQRLYTAHATSLDDAPVMAEAAESRVLVGRSEAGVTYSFAEPVSIRSTSELVFLSLAPVTFAAEVSAIAAPIRDQTAYRVAKITNETGQELLPSESAAFFIGGELVGRQGFDGLIAEAEGELGFGPIDGLRVSRVVLEQSEGERGVISRSNQRNATAEIEVENLTQEAWALRITDRVPYSEQEDLQVTWSASPTPSEVNVEKQRGILAWDLDLQPGSTRAITLNTRLDWPDGKVLR